MIAVGLKNEPLKTQKNGDRQCIFSKTLQLIDRKSYFFSVSPLSLPDLLT